MIAILLLICIFSLESSQVNDIINTALTSSNVYKKFGGEDGLVIFSGGIYGIGSGPNNLFAAIHGDIFNNPTLGLFNTQGTLTQSTSIGINSYLGAKQSLLIDDKSYIFTIGVENGMSSIKKYYKNLNPVDAFGTNGVCTLEKDNLVITSYGLFKTEKGLCYAGGSIAINAQDKPFIAQFNPTTGAVINIAYTSVVNLKLDNFIVIDDIVIGYQDYGTDIYIFRIEEHTLIPLSTINYGNFISFLQYDPASSPRSIFVTSRENGAIVLKKIDIGLNGDFNIDASFNETGEFRITVSDIDLGMEMSILIHDMVTIGNKLFLAGEHQETSNHYPLVICLDISNMGMIHLDTTFYETGYWKYSTTYNMNDYDFTNYGITQIIKTSGAVPGLLVRTDYKIINIPLTTDFLAQTITPTIVRSIIRNLSSRLQVENEIYSNTAPFLGGLKV